MSTMSIGQNTKEMLAKGALIGALGAIGSTVLMGENGSVPLFGTNLPASIVVGGACGLSSLVADTAKDYILPNLPNNQKFSHVEGAALGLGASGISTCLILRAAGAPHESYLRCVGVGAASYAAGDYIYHNFVDKTTGGILF